MDREEALCNLIHHASNAAAEIIRGSHPEVWGGILQDVDWSIKHYQEISEKEGLRKSEKAGNDNPVKDACKSNYPNWALANQPPNDQRRILVHIPEFDDRLDTDSVCFGQYLPNLGVWRIDFSPSDWKVDYWAEFPKPPTEMVKKHAKSQENVGNH